MISIKDSSFSYGPTLIFDKISFSVPQGFNVGLTGPNGAGKTTLLKLIAGVDTPDQGKIEVVGKIAWAPQEVKLDPELETSETVRSYLKGDVTSIPDLIGDKQSKPIRHAELVSASPKTLKLVQGDENKIATPPARDDDVKPDYQIKQALAGLELGQLKLGESPKKLSGGEKTKLALAKALVSDADILLLDEPTNFLDTKGKRWVMSFLAKTTKTVLIISHDLKLLDKNIDKVLAVNPQTRKVEEYKGNYSTYLRLKKEHDELTRRQVINQQKKIKKMEQSISKLYRLTSVKGVHQRVVLQRRLERLKESLPELPKEVKKIKLRLPEPLWVGEIPIKAKDISKAYDNKRVLNQVNFYLTRGEKLALIGPNGAGKSTLIKILIGEVQPDLGEVIKDEKLDLGYYSQEFDSLDLVKSVYETIRQVYPQPESVLRAYLARFLFLGDKVHQDVISLSGGEKTRLSIALLLVHSHNLLILDEPTTYLDVISQRVILEALKGYQGAMIVVSHTEDFIKELKPNRALFLPENEIKYWDNSLLDKVSKV